MEGQRRILDLCVDAGETLLANGAEIYRVQQTMEIIARSYGARSFHVYVLTNGLFASMEDGGAVQSAAVRSTPRVEMNLGRISAVNALSREIVAGRVPLEEAFARLAQIRATRGLPGWLMVSASAFSAACFCYLFGGSAVDAFTALAPGFAVGLFTRALARGGTSWSPTCFRRAWWRWSALPVCRRWGWRALRAAWIRSSSGASSRWCRASR